ncbi:hypothetical protein ABH992_007670 [Bradyrhizobium yuanmingense]|uniref:Uncharacterized protein n=1 Tax=Bradyrhizobium yuanmingense TaxID=108015 RepID=A0ABV4GU72_9BRAD
MVERVLHRLLDDALRFGGGEAILGLALEFGLAHEHRKHHGGAHHHVFRGDGGGALALADALGVILQAAQQRAAQAGFVGAAVGRRHGVGIGGKEAVGIRGPGHRPFAGAVRAVASRLAGEDVRMHQRVGVDRGSEIVLEAAREVERRFRRHVLYAFEQLGRAVPADLDAAEQVGLRARHLEQALRLERGLLPEDVGVGLEAHARAAAVVDLAEVLELALGMAALEGHAVELLAARDLDFETRGEGVHHGDADAVQTARGLVDLAVELAARMQRAHDDFERRLLREFRMRIDGDAAAVVGDGQETVRTQLDSNEGRMPGQRLVHRVVDDFGEQMMQRLLVGAANIHAGPAPHRFQPLEHLDVGCRVIGFPATARRRLDGCAGLRLVTAEEIVFCFWLQLFGHIS